jgi:hypothetical protein
MMATYFEPCWSYAFNVGEAVALHRFVGLDRNSRAVLPHGGPVYGVLEAMLESGQGVVTTHDVVEVEVAEGEQIICGPHRYVTTTVDGKARMAKRGDRCLGVAIDLDGDRVRVALMLR